MSSVCPEGETLQADGSPSPVLARTVNWVLTLFGSRGGPDAVGTGSRQTAPHRW
jgi:hypothetical protein